MELKANELRIGNYLNFLGKVVKVEFVSNLDKRKDMYWIKTDGIIPNKIFHFKPIPLTEEWLLKFEEINWIYKDINGIYYWFNGEKKYLKFVHSLQNTYFCIEQKEVLCVNI